MGDINSIVQRFRNQLMNLPHVQGVGIGEKGGREVIKVFVDRKLPESQLQKEDVVPRNIEGVETDVEEIGVVTSQQEQEA
jgi:hypothetical protein